MKTKINFEKEIKIMDKKTLIEVLKANKGVIARRALIAVGAAAGLALVAFGIKKINEDDCDGEYEGNDDYEMDFESDDSSEAE